MAGPARRAFSLLELVVILVIVATIAAIASPRYFNALTNYRVEGVGHRIVADLELARETARSRSTSVTVTFDVDNNRYGILGVQSLDDPSMDVSITLSAEPYNAQLVSADFGGDEQVIFDGHGMPDSGGAVTVACGASTKVITLDLETGLGSVQPAP